MRISEISNWKVGTLYSISLSEDIYKMLDNDLVSVGNERKFFTEQFSVKEIAVCEFEEVADWSRLKVDAKVFVRDRKDREWEPRHFAKFEGGRVFCWDEGKTSFTGGVAIPYVFCKLRE